MCTAIRFTDDQGSMYAGRNLDWECGYGQGVTVTPRNYVRHYCFEQANTGYAIVGTCIIVNALPLYFDCGNEKGLYVAGLNFPGYTAYEQEAQEDKTNIAAYEFSLWVASTFASVDEAEAALQNVAIVAKPVSDEYPVSFLHYFICDAHRSIVVEYLSDGIHIHHNDVDVLTNQPTFDWHRENLRNYLNLSPEYGPSKTWGKAPLEPYGSGGQLVGLPGSNYSPDRFVRAAYYNSHYPVQAGEQPNVVRLLRTLLSVEQTLGGAKMEDGQYEYTLYTSGYSAHTQTYYVSHYEDPALRAYPLRAGSLEASELFTFA